MDIVIKDINNEAVIVLSSIEDVKVKEPAYPNQVTKHLSIKLLVEKNEYILSREEANKLSQAINSGII